MNDPKGILDEVKKAVVGKDGVLVMALLAILAGGHILLEDIPGVGKTTMALAFSKVLSLKYNRVQFTPDVLPSDIVGFSVYNKATGAMEYKDGAILCNLFLADELNRATSRTQSALLEAMEERTVTVDGVTHPVPDNTGYITEGQFYLRNGRIEPFGSLSRLKQQVNGKTRKDHRAIMDGMIRLYASYKDTLEKKSMGFNMSAWDEKLLKYGEMFESEMMDLSKNIALEDALDLGWKILKDCFDKDEVGIKTELIEEHWPR